MIDRKLVCCFSGHRKIPKEILPQVQTAVEKAIFSLIERGVVFFGAGGAYGFDMLVEETVLRLKKQYPHIRLVLVLPCPPEQQTLKWNNELRNKYYEIIKKADNIKILSQQYTSGCMLARDRHMVNNSAYLICYLRERHGGTAYTVSYAEQQGIQILRL